MLGLKIFATGALFTVILTTIIVLSGRPNSKIQLLLVAGWFASVIAMIVGIMVGIWL